MQWQQLDHMQTMCTSLQTDNHTNTTSLNFYRPDALPDVQPTVSKHWRQYPDYVYWKSAATIRDDKKKYIISFSFHSNKNSQKTKVIHCQWLLHQYSVPTMSDQPTTQCIPRITLWSPHRACWSSRTSVSYATQHTTVPVISALTIQTVSHTAWQSKIF